MCITWTQVQEKKPKRRRQKKTRKMGQKHKSGLNKTWRPILAFWDRSQPSGPVPDIQDWS